MSKLLPLLLGAAASSRPVFCGQQPVEKKGYPGKKEARRKRKEQRKARKNNRRRKK